MFDQAKWPHKSLNLIKLIKLVLKNDTREQISFNFYNCVINISTLLKTIQIGILKLSFTK
jgi:hypothetical protein